MEGYQNVEQQNSGLREDIATLKFKLKESQLTRQDPSLEDAIQNMQSKIDKLTAKNSQLNKYLD